MQALESEKVPWQQLTQQQQRQLQQAAEAAEAARAAAEARLKQVMAEATEASGELAAAAWLGFWRCLLALYMYH
jgi:hypothetical protein